MQLSNEDSENIWILRDACRFNRSKTLHHNSRGSNIDNSTNYISKESNSLYSPIRCSVSPQRTTFSSTTKISNSQTEPQISSLSLNNHNNQNKPSSLVKSSNSTSTYTNPQQAAQNKGKNVRFSLIKNSAPQATSNAQTNCAKRIQLQDLDKFLLSTQNISASKVPKMMHQKLRNAFHSSIDNDASNSIAKAPKNAPTTIDVKKCLSASSSSGVSSSASSTVSENISPKSLIETFSSTSSSSCASSASSASSRNCAKKRVAPKAVISDDGDIVANSSSSNVSSSTPSPISSTTSNVNQNPCIKSTHHVIKDSKERQREALLEYIANLSQSKNIQLQQQQQQSQSEAFVHPASVHPYFKMPGYNENVSPQIKNFSIANNYPMSQSYTAANMSDTNKYTANNSTTNFSFNYERGLSQRVNGAPYASNNQTSSFKNSNTVHSSPLVAYMQHQKQKDAEASSISSNSSSGNAGAVPVQRILKTPSKRDSSLGM